MNYIKELIEDQENNRILDLEIAFRRKFYKDGLRIIITGDTSTLRFSIFDINFRMVAIADAYDYQLQAIDLNHLGYKKDEISYKTIDSKVLENFWLNFLNNNFKSYKSDYLQFQAQIAESRLEN